MQKVEIQHSKALIRAISQIPKSKRCLTSFKIRKLVAKTLNDENISSERALMRLKGLFHITKTKRKVNGKRLTFYQIKGKVQFKQFLKEHSIPIATFERALLI